MSARNFLDEVMDAAEAAEPLVQRLTEVINDLAHRLTADARKAMRAAWKANSTEPLRDILTAWGELDEQGRMHNGDES